MKRFKKEEGAIWKAQREFSEEGAALLLKIKAARRAPRTPEQVVRSREDD